MTVLLSSQGLATLEQQSDAFLLAFSLNIKSPVCERHMSIVGEKGFPVHDVFRNILLRRPDDGECRALRRRLLVERHSIEPDPLPRQDIGVG